MQLRLRECADRDISFLFPLFVLSRRGAGRATGRVFDIKIIDFTAPPTDGRNKLLVGARWNDLQFIATVAVRLTFAPLQVALQTHTYMMCAMCARVFAAKHGWWWRCQFYGFIKKQHGGESNAGARRRNKNTYMKDHLIKSLYEACDTKIILPAHQHLARNVI